MNMTFETVKLKRSSSEYKDKDLQELVEEGVLSKEERQLLIDHSYNRFAMLGQLWCDDIQIVYTSTPNRKLNRISEDSAFTPDIGYLMLKESYKSNIEGNNLLSPDVNAQDKRKWKSFEELEKEIMKHIEYEGDLLIKYRNLSRKDVRELNKKHFSTESRRAFKEMYKNNKS